jgi:hypothetical protein
LVDRGLTCGAPLTQLEKRCSSQIDATGRVLFAADVHRDNGKGFIVSDDA